MKHIEETENSNAWTQDDIGLRDESTIQATLEGMYQNKSIYENILCVWKAS